MKSRGTHIDQLQGAISQCCLEKMLESEAKIGRHKYYWGCHGKRYAHGAPPHMWRFWNKVTLVFSEKLLMILTDFSSHVFVLYVNSFTIQQPKFVLPTISCFCMFS